MQQIRLVVTAAVSFRSAGGASRQSPKWLRDTGVLAMRQQGEITGQAAMASLAFGDRVRGGGGV